MTDAPREERLRDNFETVYRVFHAAEYGFGGNTSVWVAVSEETDDRITGRLFGPTHGLPGERIAIQKDNVAGWQEERSTYLDIPAKLSTIAEDHPERALYLGVIDNEEFNARIAELVESDYKGDA